MSRGSEVPGEFLYIVKDVVSDGDEPHKFPNSAPVVSVFLTAKWVVACCGLEEEELIPVAFAALQVFKL